MTHPLENVWPLVVKEFDLACGRAKANSRRETVNELAQVTRRLKNYQTQGDWADAILDGAVAFAGQAALFAMESSSRLRLIGQRKLNLPGDFKLEASTAPAFADAIASKEAVIALRTPEEVSEALAPLPPSDPLSHEGGSVVESTAGSTSDGSPAVREPALAISQAPAESEYLPLETPERCFLVPLLNRTRVVAVLFAGGGDSADLNAVELIATVGAAVASQSNARADLVTIGSGGETAESAPTAAKPTTLPSWADLAEADRNLHIRAQRFARVRVAEMQLYKPSLCQQGTEHEDLYLYLKQEIDGAREAFRTQFMTIPSMVDYLHLELVSALAHGDEFRLGADYPGQLA